MKRRAFTLIEVLITVLILSILSSVSLVVWNSMVDKTRQEICQQNELILLEALKFYVYDNEAVPTSLSKLVPEYTDFAIASLKKDRPYVLAMRKICLALLSLDEGRKAWAKPSFKDYLGMSKDVLHCPAKKGEGISYGFNASLLLNSIGGTSASKVKIYEYMVENDAPIICDCDASTFYVMGGKITGAAFRHGGTLVSGIANTPLKAMVVTGLKGKRKVIEDYDPYYYPDPLPYYENGYDASSQ